MPRGTGPSGGSAPTMLIVDHYEVLGVARTAGTEEIRAAYLAAARISHPDVLGGDETERARSEDRMRGLNLAWEELSDPGKRARYDEARFPRIRSEGAPSRGEPAPSTPWRPYDPAPPVGFDERHDRPITSAGLPGWLRVAPVLCFVAGVASVVLGGFTGLLPIVAFGLFSIVASMALFVIAPLVALTSSHRGTRARRTRS